MGNDKQMMTRQMIQRLFDFLQMITLHQVVVEEEAQAVAHREVRLEDEDQVGELLLRFQR